MIRLLVDSASDYTQEEIENKNLYFVPLQIQIEGKNYLDGVDIDKETFYEKMMNSKEFFKTSQPSPQEFLDIFEKVKEKQETLICLSLSSKLSGTYQSACLAKDMVDYENIFIIDTLTAVADGRGSTGDIENVTTAITAVAEAYPELKSNENYKTLMNELSMTENMIAEYRSNYNKQIKEYKRYVRKFPTRQFLGLLGYEVQEYEYLDYNAPVDAPQDLFKED